MLITSEQTGHFILLRVISLTVMLALHDEQITIFCGAGIPGNGGNIPGAGGIGNSPGAGIAGNCGKSSNLGSGGKSPGAGNSPSGGNSPGGGIGGFFFFRL